jgi:hypothetical protein
LIALFYMADSVLGCNCPMDQYCVPIFMQDDRCVPKLNMNDNCLNKSECMSGVCSNGKCGACSSSSPCPSNHYCTSERRCNAKLSLGVSCLSSGQCLSGTCSSSKCICKVDSQCSQSQYCKNGQCLVKGQRGKSCGIC